MRTKKIHSFLFFNIPLSISHSHFVLFVLFFLSGWSALIYQIMWQRLLFIIFGVDTESITIIVSVFMFGLGIGGLLGGYIADKIPTKLLSAYIIIEVCIALFGFLSPTLFELFGNFFFANNKIITGVVCFLLLAFPTILMGATLPILVTHVDQINKNIGRSVGALYFANTLGGAIGAYFAGFILLYSMDITGAIFRAAGINLMIALIAFVVFRRGKKL